MEAARLIKGKNPHSLVEVKDLKSGDVTAVANRRGERCPVSSARPASAPTRQVNRVAIGVGVRKHGGRLLPRRRSPTPPAGI